MSQTINSPTDHSPAPQEDVQSYFDALMTWATGRLTGDEVLTGAMTGEDSDFVRFNGGDVRQAGSVRQRELTIDLIEGSTHAAATVQLSQDAEMDRARLDGLLVELRDKRATVPPGPVPPVRHRRGLQRTSSRWVGTGAGVGHR